MAQRWLPDTERDLGEGGREGETEEGREGCKEDG